MSQCFYPYGNGVDLSCERNFIHRLVPFLRHYAKQPGCETWWTTAFADKADKEETQ